MQFVIAPNSFRDGPDAHKLAVAIAEGVQCGCPRAVVDLAPLADGGDGTLAALMGILGGEIVALSVSDPLGRTAEARWGITKDGSTAVIEMAEASGLRLVSASERDPLQSSTYGTGELIRAALDRGVSRILLGAGGSGTLDGGAGALAALGARFLDDSGNSLEATPAALARLKTMDLDHLDRRLKHVDIIVLCDVHTQLSHNAVLYGLQKGIRPETAWVFEGLVKTLGELASRCGHSISSEPWVGAGGGLAGGLTAFCGARAVGGAAFIIQAMKLPERLRQADLVITAEGTFDETSFQGKLPMVVASLAADMGLPTTVLAGQIDPEAVQKAPSQTTFFGLNPGPCTQSEALANSLRNSRSMAEQIARLFCLARAAGRKSLGHC
jgi:glycerate 2-kinase